MAEGTGGKFHGQNELGLAKLRIGWDTGEGVLWRCDPAVRAAHSLRAPSGAALLGWSL